MDKPTNRQTDNHTNQKSRQNYVSKKYREKACNIKQQKNWKSKNTKLKFFYADKFIEELRFSKAAGK